MAAAFCALLLYAVELGLGVTDPVRGLPADGWIGAKRLTWGHEVRLNKLGLRERELPSRKPAGAYRVMVLGDSLTWGTGVAQEERFTDLAEALLREKLPGEGIAVWNMGQEGASTVDENKFLQETIAAVRPDRVVVAFCFNDTQVRPQDYSPERELFERRARPWFGFLRRASRRAGLPRLGQAVEKGTYRLAELVGAIPTWTASLDRTYEPASEDWKSFARALRGIKEASDRAGLPRPIFAALTQAVYGERPTNYDRPDAATRLFLKWYRLAGDEAARIGFETLDFTADYAAAFSGKVPVVNALDGHPSAELHRLYARKLADALAPDIGRGEKGRGSGILGGKSAAPGGASKRPVKARADTP